MDLMTKCPQCGTAFSASTDQLQLRKGYIRCVNCAHIFDGYEAVVPQGPNATPAAAPASAQVPEPPTAQKALPQVVRQRAPVVPVDAPIAPTRSAAEPWIGSRHSAQGPIAAEPTIDFGADHIEDTEPTLGRAMNFAANRPEPGLYSHAEALEDTVRPASGVYAEPQERDEFHIEGGDRRVHAAEALPEFLHNRRRPRGAFARLLWSVLILVGLVLLALQLAYVYRMQIASNVPLLRPVLERACEPLQCKVGYPRRIERIAIMDSSLQAAAPAGAAKPDESTLLLRVVLRNNYDKPQTWPALTLDLVDFSGSIVARRKLEPSAYLPVQAQGGPFPAASEIHIAVPVTVSGVKINGYQLGKFYPPEG